MAQLQGHSITYRIAVGPQAARKVFTLQTLPASDEPFHDGVGQMAGFSLHAGVAARAHERNKLERLCRYISRPAVSEKRLSLTSGGNVRYQFKTPYRDGTTHVMALRASCPPPCGPAFGCSKSPPAILSNRSISSPGWLPWYPPRVNLTRFGVFTPDSAHRAGVMSAKRGKGNKCYSDRDMEEQTPADRRASMSWAQRLKRVFNIDIETCAACGGAVKLIACIEDPVVIKN